jgi:hypothetical protein
MSGYLMTAALLLGLGAAAWAHTLLDICAEALLVRRLRDRYLGAWPPPDIQPEENQRYPLAIPFPTVPAYMASMLIGLLLWLALEGSFLRISAALALLAPYAIRRYLEFNRSQQVSNEVRALLMDLRLELAGGGTLLSALRAIEESGPPLLSKLLRGYLSGYAGGGLTILEWLARDTQDDFLHDLTVRASAALSGGLSMDEAVQQSLQRIVGESNTRLREELQRSPARLTLIAIPLLLGPLFVLWVIPLGAKVLAGFSGDGAHMGGY